jgi:hypothetical protein
MTGPDPRYERADTRAALADPHYVEAWDRLMSGEPESELTLEEVEAVSRARKLTGTPGAGLPMPIREGA